MFAKDKKYRISHFLISSWPNHKNVCQYLGLYIHLLLLVATEEKFRIWNPRFFLCFRISETSIASLYSIIALWQFFSYKETLINFENNAFVEINGLDMKVLLTLLQKYYVSGIEVVLLLLSFLCLFLYGFARCGLFLTLRKPCSCFRSVQICSELIEIFQGVYILVNVSSYPSLPWLLDSLRVISIQLKVSEECPLIEITSQFPPQSDQPPTRSIWCL